MATDTALLVIDLPVGAVGAAHQREEIVARLAEMVAKARAAGTPIQVLAARTPAEGELVIRTRAGDAVSGTPLREALTARGVRRLVVTGVPTERCVDATGRRAASAGVDVTRVADGHTSAATPTLPAAPIIAHHTRTLWQLAHPDHPIAVRPRAAIAR